MRGLYYLTSQNHVRHLDIMSKVKYQRGSATRKSGGLHGSEEDAAECKKHLVFTRRETFKDDSYLVGKLPGYFNNMDDDIREQRFVEQEIADIIEQ